LARQIYQNYLQRVPQSTNRAQVELAIARTYEQENNWEAAIRQYDGWLQSFTNHDARPRAEYLRAYANFQDGRDTNALTLFANMAAQFPADPLAPLAQWWVAGYYFEHGDLVNAEKNYQLVFKNWPTSNLKYQAYMWAGRAAFARNSPKDAIDYFTNITSKLDCPADLRAQAMFAYGDALMSLGPPESVRANLGEAIRVFRQLQQTYPESAQAVLAWGAIGNCYKQLGDFEQAANEYEQLLNSPRADVAARSQAIYGLADIVEKQAQGAGGEEQLRLLNRALDYYLDVLNEKNLRDGEVRDFFWTKKAGLDAERLAEALQNWNSAAKIYERLQDLFPPQREAFERKRLKVLEHTRDKN
jgi:TolA-binding protein